MNGRVDIRKRKSIEIMVEILQNTIYPTPPTRVMYSCNVNHKVLHRYIKFLMRKGFLERIPQLDSEGRQRKRNGRITYIYLATEKARRLLLGLKANLLYELMTE